MSDRFQGWMIALSVPEDGGKKAAVLIRLRLLGQLSRAGQPVPLGQPAQGDDSATPLRAAINGFNTAHNSICGIKQPPLTEEEVVAAIRWWKGKRDEAPVNNREFSDFQKIADTRELPDGTRFELISEFQPASLKSFHIWSVRIRMPYKSGHGGTYAYIIREQHVRSEVIDDSQIAWGAAAASGLQAGVRLEPRSTKYASGQQATPIFYYRNTGDQALDTTFPNLMTPAYSKIVAVDSFAKEIPIEQDRNPAAPVGWLKSPLPPGAIHEIRGLPITLGEAQRGAAQTVIKAAIGQTVRLSFQVPFVATDDKPLETGQVVFFVATSSEEIEPASGNEASGQPESKAAESRWHSVNHFPTFQAKVIACSPDGKRVAVGRDAASPQDAAKYFEEPVPANVLLPGVDVLDGGTKVATFLQTSEEQEKLLAQ